MNKTRIMLAATAFGLLSMGLAGCSEDTQDKWEKAGKAVGEAAEDTAREVKKGAQEVIKNAKETDPDSGMAK